MCISRLASLLLLLLLARGLTVAATARLAAGVWWPRDGNRKLRRAGGGDRKWPDVTAAAKLVFIQLGDKDSYLEFVLFLYPLLSVL